MPDTNLDCENEDDLWEFWRKHLGGRRYKELFPEGGRNTRVATRDLANYAANKATAMACRRRGDIDTASWYECICENIYSKLPEFARW